jgi:hypothetical protein
MLGKSDPGTACATVTAMLVSKPLVVIAARVVVACVLPNITSLGPQRGDSPSGRSLPVARSSRIERITGIEPVRAGRHISEGRGPSATLRT